MNTSWSQPWEARTQDDSGERLHRCQQGAVSEGCCVSSSAMWAAILSCALLLVRTATSELQFVVLVPALLKANNNEKVCVHLTSIQQPTPLKVVLDHANFSITIFDEFVPVGDAFFKCADVFIPGVVKADIAYVSITAGVRKERKSVVVNGVENICVMQTDKPIYKAGQEVKFRAICLNGTFFPVKETFTLVEFLDPSGNRLMQQRNTEAMHSYATFSYPIIQEPDIGYYRIQIETASGHSIYHAIEVQEYVLPKFEAKINAPRSVSILDDTITISISGSYTFGQPLVAKVSLLVCRKPNFRNRQETCNLDQNGICEAIKGDLGPDGVLNVTVELQKFQLSRTGLQMVLSIEATVTENGTDVQVMKSTSVYVSRQMAYVNFDNNMDQFYKRGLNFSGSLILRGVNNNPLPKNVIELYIDEKYVTNCTTDENGKCPFSIDTTNFVKPSVVIKARYRKYEQCFDSGWRAPTHPTTEYHITRFYSRSGSFLKVARVNGQQSCGQAFTLNAEYILNREALGKGAAMVTFYYVALSKAVITANGQVDVPLGSALPPEMKGTFSFSLSVTYKLAPVSSVVVFTVLSTGEIVADQVPVEVEHCFQNQVYLRFSVEKGLPGANLSLHLEAAPDSHCGLRAIDQSVNLLSGGRDQSLGNIVYNQMPYQQLWGYFQEGFDLNDQETRCINLPNIIHEGLPYLPLDVNGDGSVPDIFKNIGLQLISGVDPRKPTVCPTKNFCPEPLPTPIIEAASSVESVRVGFSSGKTRASVSLDGSTFRSAVVESVRTFFPETWLFIDAALNPDGTAVIPATLPDTITQWRADMFCTSESQGFGATQIPASVIAFQEFFLEVTLPFSIIRKEVFILKVTVFNYLQQCVRLHVLLADSRDYTAESLNTEHAGCVCQNERTTYSWTFTAKALGYINISVSAETIEDGTCNAEPSAAPRYKDTVIQQLLVEPEGIKREETQSTLICTKEGPSSESIGLKLPENLVEDSARAFVTCLGDPLGISMQNLQNLVQMPSGCGEQNMAKFMSNLVAYEYLNATGSLTPEREAEIRNNLNTGYAKQLTFYNSRGFFSTWSRSTWNRNPLSNIWLTAMSYASLVRAQKLIFVDSQLIHQTESWLASQQNKKTGAFENDGRSYNNIVQGNASFTAYITVAFLKAKNKISHPVVREALRFLDKALGTDDTHDQALMCYTYALAADAAKQKLLLGKLASKEVKDGNAVHLKCSKRPTYKDFFYSFPRRSSSDAISTTANYLLCLLSKTALSAQDLTHAAGIGQWLSRQMNSHGGFASTADTAVALEAMSKFQQRTYTKDSTNTVDLKFSDTRVQQFNVDNANRLLLQRKDLSTVPGNYTVDVTGTGCAYVQTTLRYNIELANMATSFNLKVWTSPETSVNGAQAHFDIHINVSYTERENSSNMAIVDVKILSGYRPVDSTLRKLRDQKLASRFETSPPGHAIFYFDKITHNTTSFSFGVEQTTVVENLQPSSAMVYDYYDPDKFGYAEYACPCSQPSSPA